MSMMHLVSEKVDVYCKNIPSTPECNYVSSPPSESARQLPAPPSGKMTKQLVDGGILHFHHVMLIVEATHYKLDLRYVVNIA